MKNIALVLSLFIFNSTSSLAENTQCEALIGKILTTNSFGTVAHPKVFKIRTPANQTVFSTMEKIQTNSFGMAYFENDNAKSIVYRDSPRSFNNGHPSAEINILNHKKGENNYTESIDYNYRTCKITRYACHTKNSVLIASGRQCEESRKDKNYRFSDGHERPAKINFCTDMARSFCNTFKGEMPATE